MCVYGRTPLCDCGSLLYIHSKGYNSTNTLSLIKGIYPAECDSIHKSGVRMRARVCGLIPWRVY